jgi:hypothetical protein
MRDEWTDDAPEARKKMFAGTKKRVFVFFRHEASDYDSFSAVSAENSALGA